MVLEKSNNVKKRKANKGKLFITSLIGAAFLLTPIIFKYFDPILSMAKYSFRIDNGSIVNDFLLRRLKGPKLYMYLYNITNAEHFLSGKHKKLKLDEIGPFTFQEYRVNEDVEINREPGVMRYTSRLQPVFLPEESCGRPEDYQNLTLPNISMLSITALLSKYPYLIQQFFNMLASSTHSKAFMKISAYDYFWGYPDPLIDIANTAVPGLIYFKSVGLMQRFYDIGADYRLELGTTDSDKFQVKKVVRSQVNKKDLKHIIHDIQYYNDTYEGAAYPPEMSPQLPINIYRQGLCRSFGFRHEGFKDMEYGGRAFVYSVRNTTFNDHELCDSKGWCPDGLMNVAPCFFGLPLAMSKGHFLDSDPRILDQLEGLKPDRDVHDAQLVIDPKLGVAVACHMSLQLNLFLADVGYNPTTRRLKDMVVPVVNVIAKQPQMLDEVKSALHVMYVQGPYILLAVQIIIVLLGFGLLAYSARAMYWKRVMRKKNVDRTADNRETLITSLPPAGHHL